MQIQIELPELHNGQEQLYSNAKRFNIVRCGRRWGKTVFAGDLLIDEALNGYPVAYFTPVYKTLEETWSEVLNIVSPIIRKKNSQTKRITLITGGVIEFWSLKDGDTPRGRKYKRVVVDEAAFIPGLLDKWRKVLRAFLTDYRGDAWFMSTPNGYNDFFKLEQQAKDSRNWSIHHQPTSSNPYIDKEELIEIEDELPDDVFEQEYLARYVEFNGKTFIQYFNKEAQVKSGLYVNKMLDVYLCFDFNITNTILVIQNEHKLIRVLKEYHLDLFDLETLCKQIYHDFKGCFFVINGDASGNSRSALTTGNASAYDIIKSSMNLSWEQFSVPPVNPSHRNSYIQCNYVFKNYTIEIDSTCEGLIHDIERVKVRYEGNKFEIIKSDDKLTHHLDPLRYHINAHHQIGDIA